MPPTEARGEHPLRPTASENAQDSVLQLWAQNNVFTEASSKDTAQTPKPKSDTAAHTGSEVGKILGDFAIDAQKGAVNGTAKVVADEIKRRSFVSETAGVAGLANVLADNAALAGLLTDSNGHITRRTVENLRMADQGSVAHQFDSKNPVSTVLTPDERNDLNFVAGHIGALGTGLTAGAIAGAKTAEIAKLAEKHPQMSITDLVNLATTTIANAVEAARKLDKPIVRPADEPTVRPEQFAQVAKNVLDKLDPKHDGVTKDQLAKAMQDHTLTGAEAQAVAAMYRNFDSLHDLSKHQWWWSANTLTTGDLDKFESIRSVHQTKAKETADLQYWANTRLKNFSTNHSEYLTEDDIERGLKDPNTAKTDRDMLQLAKKYYDEMDTWYNTTGLKASDFEALSKKYESDSDGKLINSIYSSCWSVADAGQQKGTTYSLYGDYDPLKSIAPDSVKQGNIGDCYFEAVLAGLAKANPAVIRDMIKNNRDGTYTVTFPGASTEPITVKAPTEAELGTYNKGSKDGVWASVVEKAYGEYRRKHGHDANTPQEGADGGGWPEPVIKLLTGKDTDTIDVPNTKQADLANKLAAAFASNPPKVIAADIPADDDFIHMILNTPDATTSDHLYRLHEYTIVGFAPDGHGGGTVEVRNPWGHNDDTPSGTFKMPLDKFMNNFAHVAIQK